MYFVRLQMETYFKYFHYYWNDVHFDCFKLLGREKKALLNISTWLICSRAVKVIPGIKSRIYKSNHEIRF